MHIPITLIKFTCPRNVLFALIKSAISHFYFLYCFLSLYISQELINILCTFFYVFLTVHHSIDLFHLPTLMQNSFIH